MKTILKTLILFPVLVLGLLVFSGCDDDPASSGPTPPACSIMYPSDGQSVTDTVMVEIRAEDEIAVTQVLLYIDGALVYETIISPYQYSWDTRVYTDSSEHQLYAIAWNQDSLSTVSDTVNVMIDYSAGAGQNVLVVANQNAGTLSMIDLLAGGAVERDIIGVGLVANDIIFANNRLHVINSRSNNMNVISLSYSGEMAHYGDPIDLTVNEQNRNPMYGVLANDGFLYISNWMTDEVTRLDLTTLTATHRIVVGTSPSDLVAVGDKVYVCNTGFDRINQTYGMGTLTVISTVTRDPINTIEIGEGKNPQFAAVDPTGKIHVVCTGNYDDIPGEIQVIDPITYGVTNYIYIGGMPGDIAINSEGIAYVAAGGLTGAPDVYRYNAVTGQILNGPANPIMVSAGAMRVVAASDNSIYVACFNAGIVDKIMGGVRVETYTVGDGPAGMVIVER